MDLKHSPVFHLIIALFFFLSSSVTLAGKTLDQTSLEILGKSLYFKAKDLSFEKDSLEFNTSYNLPDPELSGEYLFAPESSDNRWAAELSWGLEWPGVYDARKKEALEKIEAARKNLEREKAERLVEIKQYLLDYILAQKKLEILDKMLLDLDSINNLARQYVEKGIITNLDLYKIRLELANIKGMKAMVLNDRADAVNFLSGIYGKDCQMLLNSMECEFPEISVPTLEEMKSVVSNSLAIEAVASDSKIATRAKKVAAMEALPSISLGYKHAFEEDTHFNGVLMGVSIPLFSSKGKQKAAKAAILESELKTEALENELNSKVEQSLRQLNVLKNQLNEIELLVETTDYHTLLLKAYENGLISLLDYLSERNYFNTAQLDLLSLKHAAASIQTELLKYRYTAP